MTIKNSLKVFIHIKTRWNLLWHQFSLAESYDYQNTTPEHNFSYINDNGWWTICVPFDMTKAEVRTMFGTDGTHGGPHVCEFTGVLRDANADGQGKGKIVLKFDGGRYITGQNIFVDGGKSIM